MKIKDLGKPRNNEWWFGELMHYRRDGWSLEWISRKLRVPVPKLQALIDKYGHDPHPAFQETEKDMQRGGAVAQAQAPRSGLETI